VVSATREAPAGLVGRESELLAIRSFLDAVRAGPSALVVVGEPGIGKTTLWNATVDLARHQELTVMSARPAESERELPFLGLGDLFADVPDTLLAKLPAPQRRALEVALLRGDGDGDPVQQRALSVAVANALHALAGSGPVLVAVDDLQWLDPPTRRVLRHAIRRIPGMPVGLLLARRQGAHDDDVLDLASALPPDRLVRITVGALDQPSLDHLLQARLHGPLAAPTLRRLGEASGGNPFFALELGRALLDARVVTAAGEPLPVPSSLNELLGSRLQRLSGRTRRLLLAAAALSRPTVDLLGAAAGGPETAETLQRAADAGLTVVRGGSVGFTHPLLASVLYSQATAAELRRLHRRLANLVSDPEERARHLALSTIEPDECVAQAIEEGATRAARRGAPDTAASLLEQATRLTPPSAVDDVLRRTLDAADQHLVVGATARARTLFEDVLSQAPEGRTRARALHRLGQIRVLEGRFRAATEYFQRALAEVAEDHLLRVAIERDVVFTLFQLGRMGEGVQHALLAVEAAEASGEPGLLAAALYYLGMARCLHGDEVDPAMLERAAAAERRALPGPDIAHPGLATGRFPLAAMLKFSGRLEEARALLGTERVERLEHGDEQSLPPVLFALGELEWWAGNHDEAARLAVEIHDVGARTGQSVVDARAVTLAAMVGAQREDVETARAQVAASIALAEATEDAPALLRSLRMRGLIELSLGRTDEAAALLQHAAELEAADGYDPGVARVLPDAVEALVAVGRAGDAELLAARLEAHVARHGRPWCSATAARCRGILAAARGDITVAITALELALDEHRRLPEPFELARTLLAKGRVERRAKQRRAARESLDQALALFESLGAVRWAELTRQEMHRIGGRAATPFRLTETEGRVAGLVAEGQTNREVAATLFMSPKTVEANLTRIYDKLGVHSRRELARSMRVEAAGAFAGQIEGVPLIRR